MSEKDAARTAIESHRDALIDISKWMYEHPEIAYEERESSARLAEYLSGNGFAVEYPAYGIELPSSPGLEGKDPKSSSAPSTTRSLGSVTRAATTSSPPLPWGLD